MFGGGGTGAAAIQGTNQAIGTTIQNKVNARAAAMQMKFAAHQSNTAYQRTMADMSLAGLNPILASGASPAATQPVSAKQAADLDLSGVVPTGISQEQLGVNQQTAKKTQENLTADTKLKGATALNYNADTAMKEKNTTYLQQQVHNAIAERNRIRADTARINSAKRGLDYEADMKGVGAAAARGFQPLVEGGANMLHGWINSAQQDSGWW